MYFTSNNYRMSPAHEETTRRIYSTPRSDQTTRRWGCHQSLQSHPLSLILSRSTTIPASLLCPTDLDGGLRSFPQAWTIWICRPIPFGILNTMEIIAQTRDDNNDRDSPESPEKSMPSPISTPPVNVSAFNSWETLHTTSNDDTFYSEDEPRRVYWTSSLGETFQSDDEPRRIYLLSPSPSPPPPRARKRKLSLGMSFPKEGGVSQHVCEACGQTIPSKDTPGPSNRI